MPDNPSAFKSAAWLNPDCEPPALARDSASCYVALGLAALETVSAWVPEIALLDLNMPGTDGYAVARRLRGVAFTQHTIIVAFTALDEPTARLSGVAAGFDAYCRKGAAPNSLLHLLQTLAR